MKNLNKLFNIIILIVIAFIGAILSTQFYVASSSKNKQFNFKCLKCHKGSKSLENIIKEKHITTAEELRYLVRKGPKAGLHITNSEKDLEMAIEYLHLPLEKSSKRSK